MQEQFVLGIDCGGTHTDAALLKIDPQNQSCELLAFAKTSTIHDDLPGSIANVVENLDAAKYFSSIERITLGTTLEINALVQGKADKVGLALSAGPGLDPVHFGIGDYVCIVPGGLDHRGVEVEKLYLNTLIKEAENWPKLGISAIACVSKFSPRNPDHEKQMGKVVQAVSSLPVTLGHKLSGQLNFPRRIATAYYNAAIRNIHEQFLKAVENYFHKIGIEAQLRLLKADGGAIPFNISRNEPVQSILSGPAASVMGVLALWPKANAGCSLLLDIGGTTTDIAMFLNGSPVIDREGMKLANRRTLVKSLASISIGVGGDSLLHLSESQDGLTHVSVGPERTGPAMAFGGPAPALLDAINILDEDGCAGSLENSRNGLLQLIQKLNYGEDQIKIIAEKAVKDAMSKITKAVYNLVEDINSKPIYTLAALKAVKEARPAIACLVGGPAECLKRYLEESLGIPVEITPFPQVANAIGAGLTIPTASLEVYIDTGKGILSAPALGYEEKISRNYDLEMAKTQACALLKDYLKKEGINEAQVEVVEADMFATLDDRGYGSKDIRVTCQIKPGIVGVLK